MSGPRLRLGSFADATETSGLGSSKATSSGACDSETKQTTENAATEYNAGFQTRVAPERFRSRIWDTRSEVCCIRLTAACAIARLRRTKLFSAMEIRHCA